MSRPQTRRAATHAIERNLYGVARRVDGLRQLLHTATIPTDALLDLEDIAGTLRELANAVLVQHTGEHTAADVDHDEQRQEEEPGSTPASSPAPLGPGEDNAEVWIPPATDPMQYRHAARCPHCTSALWHERTRRCGTCGRHP